MSYRRIGQICVAISVLVLLQIACAVAAPQPTSTPVPTDTPEPTITPTLTSTATATATATASSTPTRTATPNRTATSAVKASATAQAEIAEVLPVMEKYKLSPDQGSLAFYSGDPYTLDETNYNSYIYNFFDKSTYSDFIYHTDITWESTGGLAGCGVILRSDGDLHNGEFYIYAIMRLQNAPDWEMYYVNNGDWKSLGHKFVNTIDDRQGGTNEMVVVAKGSNVKAYINGAKMTDIDYNKLSKGQVAEIAWQDSGKTSCTFANTWIWTLK